MNHNQSTYSASPLGLLSRGFLNVLLTHLRRRDFDVDAFLELAKLSQEDVQNNNYGLSDLIHYCRLAIEFTGDEFFPIRAGRRMQLAGFPVIGILAMHSPTIKQVVEDIVFFINHTNKGDFKLGLVFENGMGHVHFYAAEGYSDDEFAPLMDLVMAGIAYSTFIIAHDVSVENVDSISISFRRTEPENPDEVARLFQVPVKFGQDINFIEIEKSFFNLPLRDYDPDTYEAMKQVMEDKVEAWLKEIPVVEHIESILMNTPKPNAYPISKAADALNVSVSTLQRKLQNEDATYKDIQNSVLKKRAIELLLQTQQSIQDIALSLGYMEVTSFYRIFKRWTNTTPSKFRKNAQVGD